MRTWLRNLLIALALAAAGGVAFVYFGVFNVAATSQHGYLVYHFLHTVMLRSVLAHSDSVKAPDLSDPARALRALPLYHQHCVQCHGAPGIAPDALAFGLRPEPPNLLEPGRNWKDAEIYWVISHGLKMTAMPAWQHQLGETELWDMTALVKLMPTLSPQRYRELAGLPGAPKIESATGPPGAVATGNAKAGKIAIERYLCVTCHRIPGVTGLDVAVGPPLAGIARHKYIAGVLVNTPQNMMRWLHDPQQAKPGSGMPDLRIADQDLRDIAAYLYTLDDAAVR